MTELKRKGGENVVIINWFYGINELTKKREKVSDWIPMKTENTDTWKNIKAGRIKGVRRGVSLYFRMEWTKTEAVKINKDFINPDSNSNCLCLGQAMLLLIFVWVEAESLIWIQTWKFVNSYHVPSQWIIVRKHAYYDLLLRCQVVALKTSCFGSRKGIYFHYSWESFFKR